MAAAAPPARLLPALLLAAAFAAALAPRGAAAQPQPQPPSQRGFNLQLMRGAGGSLAPPSLAGVFTDAVSKFEFDTLAAKDRSKFLSTWGFDGTPATGAPAPLATPLAMTVTTTGQLDIREAGAAQPLAAGGFVMHCCNALVRGQALAVVALAPQGGAAALRHLLLQAFKTARGQVYVAAQFFEPDGMPAAPAPPAQLARFLMKHDRAASLGSPVTAPGAAEAAARCGYWPI